MSSGGEHRAAPAAAEGKLALVADVVLRDRAASPEIVHRTVQRDGTIVLDVSNAQPRVPCSFPARVESASQPTAVRVALRVASAVRRALVAAVGSKAGGAGVQRIKVEPSLADGDDLRGRRGWRGLGSGGSVQRDRQGKRAHFLPTGFHVKPPPALRAPARNAARAGRPPRAASKTSLTAGSSLLLSSFGSARPLRDEDLTRGGTHESEPRNLLTADAGFSPAGSGNMKRVTRRPPRGSDGSYGGPCGPAWTERPGRPRRLTGRGAPPGFGARRTGTAVSGLRPVSARPTAPGGNRRTNHRRRSTYAVSSGVSFECRQGSVSSVAWTGARTDPPETSSAEVCSFQLSEVCSFRLLLTP